MKLSVAPVLSKKRHSKFRLATDHYAAEFNQRKYLERTQRNHYWLGGPSGQSKLHDLSVGVAGLGGMGSNIAETLVRMGVGHLRIADPDTIDYSNINRQVIANQNTVGAGKAETSAKELRQIAKDFELVVYNQGITEETVEEFISGCDAVVDEIDVFPLDKHVLLHRACQKQNIPVYSAYVVGVGIHFYKFHGSDYTFEDFLGGDSSQWQKPTAQFLLDKFGPPYASYLKGSGLDGYAHEIMSGKVPIFGPATLLGHSVVSTRLILDLLGHNGSDNILGNKKTPVMPNFLVLDSCDLTLKECKAD